MTITDKVKAILLNMYGTAQVQGNVQTCQKHVRDVYETCSRRERDSFETRAGCVRD